MPTTRAAASSIASGIPSSRRQISAIAAAFATSSAKADSPRGALHEEPDRIARAVVSTSDDGSASGSDRSGHTCSPSTASPSRLVASKRTPGHSRRILAASAAGGVEQVLTVVEHQEEALRAQVVDDALRVVMPARGWTPRLTATTCPIVSASLAAASSHSHAPSGYPGSSSAAT